MTEEFFKYLQHPERLNELSLPHLKEIVDTYPTFQAAWMLLLKNLKLLADPDFESYLKIGALRVADRKLLYHFLFDEIGKDELEELLTNEFIASASYQLPGSNVSSDEETLSGLVRSIQQKSEKRKLDEYDPDTEVKFVTETLAKIYAKQGLHKEAIRAYEKLSLKYPEKSAYFAGQIRDLKQITEK